LASAIWVGVAGWSYKDWEGVVYPLRKERGFDPLAYLAQYVDLVEINTTFYRPPAPQMCKSWVRRVCHNSRFRFTAKLWQKFTHEREGVAQGDIEAFKRGLEPLATAGRLGCLLIQFPWSFRRSSENQHYVAGLIESFRQHPLALEVRHASWDSAETYTWLAEAGVGFCNIDQPLFDRSLRPSARATGPVGYVRLHGRNYQEWFRESAGRDDRYNYLYSEEELVPWVEKIIQVAGQVAQTYVVANNHFAGKALTNALQIISMMHGEKVRVPEVLRSHYPALEKIAAGE